MNDAPRELTYSELAVGDQIAFKANVTSALVAEFAKLSGDMNPLHMDQEYAGSAVFHDRVAHGMLVGALFSQLVGMHLPGKYSLYLSQTLRFHHPIALGTEITIRGEVTHKTDAHKTITLRTTAESPHGDKIFVSGEAMVQLLK